MNPFDARPSGSGDRTLFEQELVNAMNDFASTAAAPAFDADVIARGSRRKRVMSVAALTVGAVIVCAGTALATIGHGGRTQAAHPAAHARQTVSAELQEGWEYAVVELDGRDAAGHLTMKRIDLGGLVLDDAKTLLRKNGLKLGTITWHPCAGTRGTVLMVFHGSPHLVKATGSHFDSQETDTVDVDLCSGSY